MIHDLKNKSHKWSMGKALLFHINKEMQITSIFIDVCD
jgi:hypothetical protein